MRSLRRAWWPVPVLSAIMVATVGLGAGAPITRDLVLWWATPMLAVGFLLGVIIKRNDTSRRFLSWELQLEYYAAQDNRRLPETIHPPWWRQRIAADRERLRRLTRWQWLQLAVAVGALVLLGLPANIPGARLVPAGLLVDYVLLCAGLFAWSRLLAPALLADLDELSRQLRARGDEPTEHRSE